MKFVSQLAALAFVTVLVLGAAAALQPVAAADEMAAKTTTHDVTATIVSIDAKGHNVTFKDDKGEDHTAPYMGDAVKQMSTFKAGDKVMLTCKDNAKGEHLGVSAIKSVVKV